MNNKLNDGVGKKIVEALKKQSEGELLEVEEQPKQSANAVDGLIPNIEETILSSSEEVSESHKASEEFDFSDIKVEQQEPFVTETKEVFEEPTYEVENDVMNKNSFAEINLNNFIQEEPQPIKFAPEVNDLDMPANIVILKKLIAQLPSGVTRHTGAQIIKQTMEALGISMKSVLKEAQEVQDNLKESAKECQATIQEYKRQITTLEKQSQNYQKQYGALNDLISLFIQTK